MRYALRYLGHRPGAPLGYFTGASVTLSPGDIFEVAEQGLFVGRRASADLRVASAIVAPRHARLWAENGTLHVADLRSPNGTWVNGMRVQEATLDMGDRLSIAGAFHFEVVALDPSETGAPKSGAARGSS